MKHLHTKLAAALTAGVLASAGTAQASDTNFTDVTGKIVESSSELPNLISTVAYIGGIGLGVAGVFKLKQHVDNPGQTPMKDGLVRMGASGGLLTLPYLTEAMAGSVGEDSDGIDPGKVQFKAVSFD